MFHQELNVWKKDSKDDGTMRYANVADYCWLKKGFISKKTKKISIKIFFSE